MPLTPSEVQNELSQALSYGQVVRIRHSTLSGATTGYDNEVTPTASGTDIYTSGLFFPIKAREGSTEAVLLQQGKLLTSDKALFINGNVNISGTFKIGLGSPSTQWYQMSDAGLTTYHLSGSPIYHKVYIRYLTTGSLVFE